MSNQQEQKEYKQETILCGRCKKERTLHEYGTKKNGDLYKSCIPCRTKRLCKHKKRKEQCRECGGSAFCIHDIQKAQCRECGGSAFCIHDIRKDKCRECGGSAFCIHDIQKAQCRECGGSSFCIHNIYKASCRECGGSSFCIHDIRKASCRECGGSALCICDKQKASCRECSDPIKITISSMVRRSRSCDKKREQYDANNFIDKAFLETLLEEYKDNDYKCYYCTQVMQFIVYRKDLISVERIDNTIGHTKSNVVFACLSCNFSRGDRYTSDEFKTKMRSL
jgi:hypothetical protein